MLILVGETINVALNGGLFNTAKDASDQTQLAINREELQSLIISKMDVSTSKIPSDLGTITTGGKIWTVTAEKVGGDIIVTLTDTQDDTNTKTYNAEDDLKIKGISIISSVTGFNNYGVTYSDTSEHENGEGTFWKIEKSNGDIVITAISLKYSNNKLIVDGELVTYVCSPVDYASLLEENGMSLDDWTFALDGFQFNMDVGFSYVCFSPSYESLCFNMTEPSYTIDNSFDWTDYE